MRKIRPQIWIAASLSLVLSACSTSTMLWNRYNQRFIVEGLAQTPQSTLPMSGTFPGIPSPGQKVALQAESAKPCEAVIVDSLVHTGYASGIIHANCPFGAGLLRFKANLPDSSAINEDIQGIIGEYKIDLKITQKSPPID